MNRRVSAERAWCLDGEKRPRALLIISSEVLALRLKPDLGP